MRDDEGKGGETRGSMTRIKEGLHNEEKGGKLRGRMG